MGPRFHLSGRDNSVEGGQHRRPEVALHFTPVEAHMPPGRPASAPQHQLGPATCFGNGSSRSDSPQGPGSTGPSGRLAGHERGEKWRLLRRLQREGNTHNVWLVFLGEMAEGG